MMLSREAIARAGVPPTNASADPVRTAVMWAIQSPQPGTAPVVPPPLPAQQAANAASDAEGTGTRGVRPRLQSSPGMPPPIPAQEPRTGASIPVPFDDESPEALAQGALAARAVASKAARDADDARARATNDAVARAATEAVARAAAEASARGSLEAAARAAAEASAKATVEAAMQPLTQAMSEILRRLEELERRAHGVGSVSLAPVPAMRATMSSYPALAPSTIPRAPALSHASIDIRAIERDPSIVVEGALDGKNRRLRLILTFLFAIIVVFAVLGFALIRSYAPHQNP